MKIWEYVSKPRKWKFMIRIPRVFEIVLYIRKPKALYDIPSEREGPQPPRFTLYCFWGRMA